MHHRDERHLRAVGHGLAQRYRPLGGDGNDMSAIDRGEQRADQFSPSLRCKKLGRFELWHLHRIFCTEFPIAPCE